MNSESTEVLSTDTAISSRLIPEDTPRSRRLRPRNIQISIVARALSPAHVHQALPLNLEESHHRKTAVMLQAIIPGPTMASKLRSQPSPTTKESKYQR